MFILVMSISLFLGEAVTGKRGRRGLFYQPLAAVGQVSDGFAGAKISRMKQMSKFIVLFINFWQTIVVLINVYFSKFINYRCEKTGHSLSLMKQILYFLVYIE